MLWKMMQFYMCTVSGEDGADTDKTGTLHVENRIAATGITPPPVLLEWSYIIDRGTLINRVERLPDIQELTTAIDSMSKVIVWMRCNVYHKVRWTFMQSSSLWFIF